MNKKNLPQNENKVKNKTSKISIISPKKNSINICKKQQSISKFDRYSNNQMVWVCRIWFLWRLWRCQ